MDLVIEGRFFVNGSLKDTAVGIEDGKIVTVGNIVRGGDERLDLGSKVILPGFVDPHVHFRDPGMTQKEDFLTGTTSALFGGVTCVLDMPNTKPPVTDQRSFDEKKRIVRKKAMVDYGLFAAITKDIDVESLAPKVAGFKLFMGSTTGNILLNDDRYIATAMRRIAGTGRRVSVHAEDDSMIGREVEKDNWDHLRNRPLEAEHNAISRLSPFRGMKVNICHVTDAASLDTAASLGFTTEVTPHHLFFNASDFHGPGFKVNPPLRDIPVRDRLFKAFMDGKATMFGTDHAPHSMTDKSQEYNAAPGGIPGVETTMPMFMALVKKGSFPLDLLVRMGSTAPSEAFDIPKGRIAVGYDADFAVFDMRETKAIDAEKLHSKAGYSPYEGMEAIFPDAVFIRGEMQLSGGELSGSPIGEDIRDRY